MGQKFTGASGTEDSSGAQINPATAEKQDVINGNLESVGNSTSTPLGIDGVFPGAWEDTLEYGGIIVGIKADQDSATDGLMVEWSMDGVTANQDDVFTVFANQGKVFTFSPAMRYLKVSYTNGGVAQTSMALQTVFKKNAFKPSSHRIQDDIVGEDDAELIKAVLTAKKPNGIFSNIKATNNENLHVSLQEYGDTPAIDAFARQRVSEPFTIFDSKQLHDKQPLFWDETLGGSATSVHSDVDSETTMSVTANAADYVIRQTKMRFNYQPGKSQLYFMTFHSPQVDGITNRIGPFDGTGTNNLTPNNGIFFESNNGLSWNICKDGVITERVAQADWNVDKLDGTGASGITYNSSSAQILLIDFEWLGVGRVRVGFIIDGIPYYVHYFNHANDPSFPSVYMSSPNLPIRYSIETDGTAAGHLDHICSSVISEGGAEKTGVLRGVDNGTTYISALTTATTYALLAIRLKSAYNDISVIPEAITAIAGTNDDFKWSLQINPTIVTALTYADLTNSSVQVAQGALANVVTVEGIVIASGYSSKTSKQTAETVRTALRIGSTIAGVQDQLVLCISPITTNLSILTSLEFRELL